MNWEKLEKAIAGIYGLLITMILLIIISMLVAISGFQEIKETSHIGFTLYPLELSDCLKVKPAMNSALVIEPYSLYWIVPNSNLKTYCRKDRQAGLFRQ